MSQAAAIGRFIGASLSCDVSRPVWHVIYYVYQSCSGVRVALVVLPGGRRSCLRPIILAARTRCDNNIKSQVSAGWWKAIIRFIVGRNFEQLV